MTKVGETYFRYLDAKKGYETKLVVKRNHARAGSKYIGNGFNDISFYKSLLSTKGNRGVELAAIGILGGRKVREIYSIYRITLQDGSTEMYDSMGSCIEDSSSWEKSCRSLVILQVGEHLTGVIAHERFDTLTGVTFVTNKRRVRVLSLSYDQNTDSDTNMTDNPPGTKIVAFCGNAKLFAEESRFHFEIDAFGFYMIPFRWQERRIYLIMRELVQRNRAQSTSASELATTMKKLSYLETDLFRTVIRFL